MDLSPYDELLQDRDQIRDALLTAFHKVIMKTSAFDSDEMAARTLLDVIAYVVSFKVPAELLDDPAEIGAFARNETLRFEMYLREHLLRRRTVSEALIVTDSDEIPTQPEDVLAEPSEDFLIQPNDDYPAEPSEDILVQPNDDFSAEPSEDVLAQPNEDFSAEPSEDVLVQSSEVNHGARSGD